MKLLTLNCHSWMEENQLEKITTLAETIKEKSYDVIALQEVNQSIDAEIIEGHIKKDNFALVLLEELKQLGVNDYQFTWDFSHIGYDIYEEGVAFLTKHSIEETNAFFVSESDDTNDWKTRKVIRIKLTIDNESMSFYSCHLGWWVDEADPFKNQFDRLYRIAVKDEKFFLMGDFNNPAEIREKGYDYIMSYGLHDTYALANKRDSGITVAGNIAGWDQNKQDLRIDYIFSSTPVEVKESTVIFNGKNKPVISDHFGVEITI
ncbi:endonuclease/exonuclease/phosphatase family protein [Bacillus tuaregi]|uniref:endonuclease/exonuclease/phosphatase family protein n=1 Tax=Bacillus tuaregi TaxID=1816695 RepID=UPI0008F959A2|nr:endonuclease/exonuclease/phosphatase family protein [Bacillus tuaregi]